MYIIVLYVRLSKNIYYEKPYIIKGDIKHTGLKELPKDICRDRVIGTW